MHLFLKYIQSNWYASSPLVNCFTQLFVNENYIQKYAELQKKDSNPKMSIRGIGPMLTGFKSHYMKLCLQRKRRVGYHVCNLNSSKLVQELLIRSDSINCNLV